MPLNVDARKALKAYLEERRHLEDDHVFIGPVVANYARRARLQNMSPHVLRHTFGKSTLDAGENLVTVATLIGHARLDTTAMYTQPSVRDLERAVARLETK